MCLKKGNSYPPEQSPSRSYTNGTSYRVEYASPPAGNLQTTPVTVERIAPYVFPNVQYRYQRDSLPQILRNNSTVRLRNGGNIGVNDQTIWTHVDRLTEAQPGTAF